MEAADDVAYKPGELTQEQLMSSTRSLFRQDSMNVFRRFPREATERMVSFYTQALSLRSLSPIQLTSSQQMLLTGVDAGFEAPRFADQSDGTRAALVADPGGFQIELVIHPAPRMAAMTASAWASMSRTRSISRRR